ncbi:MAG: hypothetical protein OEU54_02395 [Gemmatimonadota bacterium]|nr:hypothetical protein [Gemmatimonadota bacterium]
MSHCDEVRETLWPLDRPRGVVAGEAEARSHLDECPACRAFFERDAMISRALKSYDLEAPAPSDLRSRVASSLGAESASGWVVRSRRFAWLRVAPWAAAAAVVGLAVGLMRPGPAVEGAYAQDFLSRAVEADAMDKPDASAVSAFFMRELGVSAPPVVLASAPMSRAMICLIDGERAAMVEYDMSGYTVAHYRVPRTTGILPRAREPSMVDENGVCVYRWTDDRFEHALVSDMPDDRLVEVALASFVSSTP